MTSRDPLIGATPRPTATDDVRARQRARAVVMGLALGAFVVLLYLITIVRIGAQG